MVNFASMRYPVPVIAIVALMACGEKKPAAHSNGEISSAENLKDTGGALKKYFPILDFLKGEIAYVDSLPVGIKKFTGKGARNKYVYINAEEFHRLAAEFTPKEIEDSFFLKEYQETSFLDKSSNSATFLYSTKNESLSLRRVDVLTVKGDVYDKVKSIYLEKNHTSGDTGYIKKLYWQPQRSFQLITQASPHSGAPQTEIINVVWDNREE